jgi:aminopeptidase YwaD
VATRQQLHDLTENLSGERILDTIHYLTQYWRWAPSHGFHIVAQHMVDETKSYGLQDAHIERFIADKKTRYFGQTMNRPSWDPIAAELWVVDPVKQKITSFSDIPMSVAGYSRNTDVTAELVDVGDGSSPEDYAGKDVKNKVVLGSGAVGSLQQMAVFQRGALGVLSAWAPDLQTSRDPIDFPDFVTWGTGVVPESATGQPSTFGIMISRRQREVLLNLMKTGKPVKVHVTVKADFEEPGYLEVASAVIPGTEFPDQEIIFSAHLDHPRPAANDNDSGSATILEIARVLEEMIKSGQLPPPKRTIRFLWVQEGRSTRSWIVSHPELSKHAIANINMDIVGSDTEKTRAILYYWASSSSHPSFVSDIVEDYFELVRNVNNDKMPTEPLSPILSQTGSSRPFIGSIQRYLRPSDQSFLISAGIPGVNFAAWPDQFHHTQFDTPDKSDTTLLMRVAFISAASAIAAANAGLKTLRLCSPMLPGAPMFVWEKIC